MLLRHALVCITFGLTSADDSGNCQDTGEWTDWGDWSTCPPSASSLMNFRRRIRQCDPRPVGCNPTATYSCPGNYSQVDYCYTTTAVPITTIAIATTTLPLTTSTSTAAATTPTTMPPTTTKKLTTATSSTKKATTKTTTTEPSTVAESTTVFAEDPTSVEATSDASTSSAAESTTGDLKSTAANTATTDVGASSDAPASTDSQLSTPELDVGTTDGEGSTTIEAATDGGIGTPGGDSSSPSESSSDAQSELSSTPAMELSSFADTETLEGDSTTPSMVETTVDDGGIVSCDGCPELDVKLYNWSPFEDASSVLNRYTYNDCMYVTFKCRPSMLNDTRSVRTIYDGEAVQRGNSTSAVFACQNRLWIEQAQQIPVSFLSCVYDVPPTTTSTPTTTVTTTSTTTTTTTTTTPFLGIDPNDPCFNCSYLVVDPPSAEEGYTYLDHRIVDRCLTVQVCCRPLNPGMDVDLLIDDVSRGLVGTAVNRTFTCTKQQKWVDQISNEIVYNVACAEVPSRSYLSSTIGGDTIETSTIDGGGSSFRTTVADDGSTNDGLSEATDQGVTDGITDSTIDNGSTDINGETTPSDNASTDGGITAATEGSTTGNDGGTTDTGAGSSDGISEATTENSSESSISSDFSSGETDPGITEATTPSANSDGITDAGGSTNGGTSDLSTGGMTTPSGISMATGDDFTGETIDTESSTMSSDATSTDGITASTIADDEPSSNMNTTIGISSTKTQMATATMSATTAAPSSATTSTVAVTTATTATQTTANQPAFTTVTASSISTLPTTITTPVTTRTSTSATTMMSTITLAFEPGEPLSSTTASSIALCAQCPNMQPVAADSSVSNYNGMLILNHFTNTSGCRTLEITCSGNTGDSAAISFSGGLSTAVSSNVQVLDLTCSANAQWMYQGLSVTIASCLATVNTGDASTPTATTAGAPGGGTPFVPTSTSVSLSTTPSTTLKPSTPNPSIAACQQCGKLPITQQSDNSYQNAMLSMGTSMSGGCGYLQFSCQGTSTSSEVQVIMGGTVLQSGTGRVDMNLTCNDMAVWTTSSRIVVLQASCVQLAPTTTSTSATTTAATTTTTTQLPTTTRTPTTATPGIDTSLCATCPNLIAVAPPSIAANQDIGMLVLDHFFESGSNCRVVVVRCKGESAYDNMTIIYNGNTPLPTTTLHASSSLICSISGTWLRLNDQIVNVSCVATNPPPNATFPITEAPPIAPPATVTVDQNIPACERCSDGPLTNPPVGYKSGFMTIDTLTNPGECMIVYISCTAPQSGETVALITQSGTLRSAVSLVNTTITCNNDAQWETTDGTVIETLSCGYVATAPTTSTTVTPGLDPPQITTTKSDVIDCSTAVWQEWREWSACTGDTCGACATHTRFRACSTNACLCPGSAYEKVPCNEDVCIWPRNPCCENFQPKPQNGRIQCVSITASTGSPSG